MNSNKNGCTKAHEQPISESESKRFSVRFFVSALNMLFSY